ncbi:MAG: MutH/Sau3AI family endonuclease [Candidatus Nanohaloarchaea archaeon]
MSHTPIGRNASLEEIEEACDALLCKTTEEISEAIHERTQPDRVRSKSAISNLIEEDYFGIPQNSLEEPDFEETGIELKVTPVYPNDKEGELLRPKERLVVSQVNYTDIIEADHWTDVPALDKKLHDVLLIWYVHLEEDRTGYPFIWWTIWNPTEEQSERIQEEFELTKEKVEAGERLRTKTGDFLGTCPRHNSDFVKENPEESEPGALVGSHPTREYEQKRAWQIKSAGVFDILASSSGLKKETRGRATGINREKLWKKAEERRK